MSTNAHNVLHERSTSSLLQDLAPEHPSIQNRGPDLLRGIPIDQDHDAHQPMIPGSSLAPPMPLYQQQQQEAQAQLAQLAAAANLQHQQLPHAPPQPQPIPISGPSSEHHASSISFPPRPTSQPLASGPGLNLPEHTGSTEEPLVTGEPSSPNMHMLGKKPHSEDDWTRIRKDNHKEVERRRRGTINQGINDLDNLVPATPGVTGDRSKGAILARAVSYIKTLKENETRNIEKWTLEKLLMDQAMNELNQRAATSDELRRAWEAAQEKVGALERENEALRRDRMRMDQELDEAKKKMREMAAKAAAVAATAAATVVANVVVNDESSSSADASTSLSPATPNLPGAQSDEESEERAKKRPRTE